MPGLQHSCSFGGAGGFKGLADTKGLYVCTTIQLELFLQGPVHAPILGSRTPCNHERLLWWRVVTTWHRLDESKLHSKSEELYRTRPLLYERLLESVSEIGAVLIQVATLLNLLRKFLLSFSCAFCRRELFAMGIERVPHGLLG